MREYTTEDRTGNIYVVQVTVNRISVVEEPVFTKVNKGYADDLVFVGDAILYEVSLDAINGADKAYFLGKANFSVPRVAGQARMFDRMVAEYLCRVQHLHNATRGEKVEY